MSKLLPGNRHAELAAFHLGGVHEWQSEEGSTDATNIAAALDAIANATLALAHEQRTANLIAYQANVESSYARLRTPQRRSEQASALNKQIIALLGLSAEVSE